MTQLNYFLVYFMLFLQLSNTVKVTTIFNTHNGVEMWMRWWLPDSIKSHKLQPMLAFDIKCYFEKNNSIFIPVYMYI